MESVAASPELSPPLMTQLICKEHLLKGGGRPEACSTLNPFSYLGNVNKGANRCDIYFRTFATIHWKLD